MEKFVTSEGRVMTVHEGFKSEILGRPSANPKSNWGEGDDTRGAKTKYEGWQSRLPKLRSPELKLEGARVLDIACGKGIDCLLLGLEPIRSVVGGATLETGSKITRSESRDTRHCRFPPDP